MKKQSSSQPPLCKLRVLICLALLFTTPLSARATTITVTNTNDSGAGSLRQALADANDGDTINFAVTGTIGLTNGELLVDKNVTISGPSAANLIVNANFISRVFHIGAGKTASISSLIITNGNVSSGNGGGILNDHAILTIRDCIVSGNHAHDAGGGISNDSDNGSATLTIVNSIVSDNAAGFADFHGAFGDGGGIYNDYGGTLMITNSVVSNNEAGWSDPFPGGNGGGIYNNFSGTLTITNSAIHGNQVWLSGGGIVSFGTLTISNSTVSGNRAIGEHDGKPWGTGGGIVGQVTLTNSTISDNYANLSLGGIWGGGTLGNTILNNNSGANITGTFTSMGYNLSSDDGGGNLTGPGDQINTDPMLGPLQDNGGLTLTHALLPGSPAIDAGHPNFTPPPSYDQRGSPFVRVFNRRIDIGSFELQPPPRPTPTPRSRPSSPPRPTPQ